MITMDDIIREGNPTLREVAKEVSLPLSEEDISLGKEMLEFLKNSQDPIKILSHSVQDACLGEGEGCLSVDREVPGYVVRHAKITVSYYDMNGEKHKIRLKNYESIVVQHEIDHINGVMFYDHINDQNPFALKEGVLVIE